MAKILPNNWIPADGMQLEPNAIEAILANANSLIIAGPGSGKTELLAQKACFLLQTGRCPKPKKILAISFKVDAAYNLKDRVHRRCGATLSKRFDSFTFDAFAKRILDRFYRGLPDAYKITDYDVNIAMSKEIENTFRGVDLNFFNTYSIEGSYEKFLVSLQLPLDGDALPTRVIRQVWQLLLNKRPTDLSFGMIMRLAELIVSTNPLVKKYIQLNYSHIFLDEFQDTTFAQFDFLNTCFFGSRLNFTAVGDDKQSIMAYAGARPDIFDRFNEKYSAQEIRLTMNWRSAPKLVRFQNFLVTELLRKPAVAVSSDQWPPDAGEAQMCFFDAPAAEQQFLLAQIRHWMHIDNLKPRDICILVKQRVTEYTKNLTDYLTANGIPARDETELQALLVEPVPVFMVNLIEVIFSGKYGRPYDEVLKFIRYVHQSYGDEETIRLNRRVLQFIKDLRNEYVNQNIALSSDRIAQIMKKSANFVGQSRIREAFPQYKRGKYLRNLLGQLLKILSEQQDSTGNMLSVINSLRGNESIPVMTAHKSKGLEFHTVVFIGLEDSAFWTYNDQKISDNNLVFVALSRAKMRAVFTFCTLRYLKDELRVQTSNSIRQIHDLIINYPDVKVIGTTQQSTEHVEL